MERPSSIRPADGIGLSSVPDIATPTSAAPTSAAPASSTGAVFAAGEGTRRVIVFLRYLLVASCALPAVILAALAWNAYGEARAEAEGRVRRTVEILYQHTLKVLETEELILDRLLAETATMSAIEIRRSETIAALLRKSTEGKEQIASIWILDADGLVVVTSRRVLADISAGDRDYFLAQKDHDGGTFVSKLNRGRLSGRPIFTLSRRRSAADGSFNGVAMVSVSSFYLQDFFTRVGAEQGQVARLIRADGETLALSPPETDPPRLAAADPLMQAIADADQGIMWRASSLDQVERLIGFRRIDHYPLYVAFAIDRATALRPWFAAMAFDGAVLIASTVVLVLVTLLALRRARHEKAALERLAAETRERATIEAQFRQAQKMEALGELTSGLAHDFNNLLSAIRVYVEVIHASLTEARPREFALAVIKEVDRADNLIRSLLAFARRQPLAVRTFDLNAAVRGMKTLLQQSVGTAVRIELALAPELWPVRADVNQTQAAILNLAINARDAMPGGGVLRIETASMRLSGDPEGLAGSYVSIRVCDTGVGMTPDILARAFEPFFSTKAPEKGSGLGLSSVYGFAKQSQGTAVIHSAPGAGTAVTIYLPRGE